MNKTHGTGSQSIDKKIDRRRLLKLMAITGGTITTSQLIPYEWVKPVVGFGTLPAHAQGSAAPLTAISILGVWNVVGPDPGGATTWTATATFSADGTVVFVEAGNPPETLGWSLSGSTLTVGGDSFTVTGDSTAFSTPGPDGTTYFTR